MQTYVVGGALRDELLGLEVQEYDHVVVGATVQQMLDLGYQPVGRDFPVFLHPQTHEEYALARTERNTGPGYRGFEIHASPDVTLEEDLLRRDLTINAMARGDDGVLVDPHGGRDDLANRWLRHISPAFAEDPVRILRVARLAAKLMPLGFKLAPETRQLMQKMVLAGEVNALVPERVWQELRKALASTQPRCFFEVLRDCGAHGVLFPEIEVLFGVPQPPQYHPEIDTGVHTLMVLDQATQLSTDPLLRFAALTHDLGKGTTPKEILPSHHGHEERGVPLVQVLCDRLAAPKRFKEFASVVTRWHGTVHQALELKPSTVVKLLERLDVFRRRERLEDVLLVCLADSRGRLGFEERDYPQADYLRACYAACLDVDIPAIQAQGFAGPQLGEELHRQRVEAVKSVKAGWVVKDGV
ncbi:tRNA nucleotidyltransferase (CCA-adding enzyme) [Ectothiorhodosinus mongolicus]|uniref:Multifunctional CCA protein n=1 Tax=Ectothiorhodosinus mongolicus TaxID=233100 RepID=A0A1R3W1N0_9GAMM|nr:multifunctional CCA addition/repair protein [Ectothiorhodosinus mongolicus]ULX57985.1 multifunctional CCA addition/repair protein [Ectothiorhodosinus mongolicus]SIT71272.1 tRNA nucleotidyltransferase (CCA-adding enzyme) [Ectothiorhodosinus mongolicus]